MRQERSGWAGRLVQAAFVAFAAAGILTAAPLGAQAPDGNPGTRAVRLSYVDGQVQISQGNQILAQQAPLNAPLFEGTQITTAEDGRAEVEFEDGSVARLAPNSSMTLTVLRQSGDSTNTEVLLQQGLGYFELQGGNATGQMRIRFGNNVATSTGFTVLRVDLDNPPGEMAVFSGNAHLENGSTMSVDMHGGETVRLNAADPTNWALLESIEPDSWDAWNSDRDQALTAQESAQTAATTNLPDNSNPAWSDLDANGDWYDVPGQGYVWSPYEAANAGWDPYGWGSWMWQPGFGYSWVSGEPWGFMPYCMGMWNFYPGFGWGWSPGGGYWWQNGGGWGANVGTHPQRYNPPVQPRGGPVMPVHGAPMMKAKYETHPVILVDRMPHGTDVSTRVRNAPRTIAGNTLQPLRPLAPRPTYSNSFASGQQRQLVTLGRPVQPGGVRFGYTGNPYGNASHSYWNGGTTSRTTSVYGRPTSPMGGGGASHSGYSSGGMRSLGGSRSSGGGGSHSSGGSGGFHGGGGGGGSHGGGGGGGGGHR
jgi:hypothetical protein